MFAHQGKPLATFAAVLITAIALGGCKKADVEEPEQDTLPKEPVPVQAVEVGRSTLRPSIDLVGTLVVIPERSTVISPQVGGWIRKVSVVEVPRSKRATSWWCLIPAWPRPT